LKILGEIQHDGMDISPLTSMQSGLSMIHIQYHSQSSASNIMNPSSEDQLHDDQHGVKGEKDSSLLQRSQSSNEMNLRGNLFLMDGGSCNSFDLLNLSAEEADFELNNVSKASQQEGNNNNLQASNHFEETKGKRASSGSSSTSHHHHHHEEPFMVEVICKKFLQLFLVGVSVPKISIYLSLYIH
jgi:hypothetical protein